MTDFFNMTLEEQIQHLGPLLSQGLRAWKERRIGGPHARPDTERFIQSVGQDTGEQVFQTLDTIAHLTLSYRPDWRGGATLGGEATNAIAALRRRLPQIPDPVANQMHGLFMHSYR